MKAFRAKGQFVDRVGAKEMCAAEALRRLLLAGYSPEELANVNQTKMKQLKKKCVSPRTAFRPPTAPCESARRRLLVYLPAHRRRQGLRGQRRQHGALSGR